MFFFLWYKFFASIILILIVYIFLVSWFFAFLHTFGRDLKWHPHIQVLIAEIKLANNKWVKWEYFDFNAFPFKSSGKTVDYICPKCKFKFEAPIEAVLEFEQEDEWNELPISTPPYIICSKCQFDKCVLIDYKSKRGYHHKYKED